MISVGGIVLRDDSKLTGVSDIKIMGRTCQDWVITSLGENFTNVLDTSGDDNNIVNEIKPFIDKSRAITVVLYADTPLITKKTVMDAVALFVKKSVNVLKMTRGWIFSTEYLLSADSLYISKSHYFEEEDLIVASDYKLVALVTDILRNRILDYHMSQGVHIVDPTSTFIDCEVVLSQGIKLLGNNHIRGKTIIKQGVVLDVGNVIVDSVIDEWASVANSRLYSCYIGKNTMVGPFAYVRPDSVIGDSCRIGDFVEVKKSIVGNNTKLSHLAYVGDAEIGNNVNIGCGVVFANFDGIKKHPTKVGDNVFIGSNSTLIAPLNICSNAYIAAGSTITDNIDTEGLVIARARQVIKQDWKNPNKQD